MATSPPPIVDGSRIGLGRQSVSDRELAEYGDELRAALSEWGIAYLVNHGFGQEEKDEAFRAAKRSACGIAWCKCDIAATRSRSSKQTSAFQLL